MMYRALVGVTILFRCGPLHLTEGALVDLKELQPGEVDFLIAAEYVEKVKGAKVKIETPESKRDEPEKRA